MFIGECQMNYIGWVIVACEVSFWILILFGLIVRYLFGWKRLGLILLALTPVIDLLLIIITSMDLYRGATATIAHGLAAVYIGVSLAFGKNMINWFDERFQYFVAKTSNSLTMKKFGREYAHQYAKGFIRHIVSFLIGAVILVTMIYYVNDPTRTETLSTIIKTWSIILAIDLYITVSYFLWPKKKKARHSISFLK